MHGSTHVYHRTSLDYHQLMEHLMQIADVAATYPLQGLTSSTKKLCLIQQGLSKTGLIRL